MNGRRPFTTLAAVIFLLMALIHVYRLVTHFQIIIGNQSIPEWVSIFGIVVPGLLSLMLFRESRS